MKFNPTDYHERTVMHCPEKWMAEVFCSFLHELGRNWSTGESYENALNWKHAHNTCYNFQIGKYSDIEYYREEEYTILSFEDFDWEEELGFEPQGFEVLLQLI